MALKRAMPHSHSYDVEKYKIEYLPLQAYGGTYAIAQDSDATVAEQDFIISAGAGAPSFGEVTDAAIVGLAIDDTADAIGILWPLPYDCDLKSDINFAVTWSSNQATTTDTVTWKVEYTELTLNTEAIEIGATALNTAIAADTNVAGVHALQQTAWGVLDGGTLTDTDPRNMLALNVSYSAESGADASSDEIYGYHLVIRYVRRAL